MRVLMLLLLVCLGTGCTSLGPQSIPRDRFNYNEALASSWKDQMLLNIVKLRYADAPFFLNVGSVVNQYSLEGEVDGEVVLVPGSDPISLGAGGTYGNKPTITYLPLRGEAFMRTMITPVRPARIFALVQAGWPVEFVFSLAVRSVNGIYNQSRIPLLERPADPRFLELLDRMRDLQRTSAVAIRLEREDEGPTSIVFLPTPAASAEQVANSPSAAPPAGGVDRRARLHPGPGRSQPQ